VIGIEIKFNRGPYRFNRKTPTPIKTDIEKLLKNKKLKRKYLLWLNWGRPMNEDYVKVIKKRYKNENVKILTTPLMKK
jgi:serine protease inhibitor